MSIKEFAKPSLLRPFVISLTLLFFQQFTGISAFMFYSATIFQRAGFHDNSTMVSMVIGATQVIFTVVAVILADRQGRRFLMLVGGVIMSLSCASMGAYFYVTVQHGYVTKDFSWMAVASMCLYIVGFALGLGPCAWLIMGESFPANARGIATGMATLFAWFCSFVVTKTFALLINGLTEAGTCWFYGGMGFLSIVFVYFFVPETKGKSLEEIQKYFESKPTTESSGPYRLQKLMGIGKFILPREQGLGNLQGSSTSSLAPLSFSQLM